nr:gag-asp_proteas domain-containing protein [Ipomoea batatas]
MSKRVQDEGDFTNVEGGRGVPPRNELETSRLAEETGSVAGDHDGDVMDLAVRRKALETYIQTLQEATRDDIELLREDNASLKVEIGLLKLAVASGRAAELRQQAVRDLPSAMPVADGLADFHRSSSQGKNGGKNNGESGNGKSISKDKYMSMETNAVAEVNGSRASTQGVCWTCDGNHFKRICPKKQKLNAVKEDEPKDDGSPIEYCGPLRVV